MYYRIYELPWTLAAEQERAFWRILRNVVIALFVLGVVLPLLPLEAPDKLQAPVVPPRLARVIIERQAPPPPPPPPPPQVVERAPEPVPVTPVPVVREPRPVQPQPEVDRTAQAREKAASSGLLQLKDQLADLRNNDVATKAMQTRNLSAAVDGTTRADRSLITSNVGKGSGGIQTAALSRGYGGGTGALTGHETTQVAPSGIGESRPEATRSGSSAKPARSREEIELVFDREKGAIYALYSRALRDNPALQGKLVLEITIAPSGEVTACEIVSSDLKDAELERKLLARIKLFRFEAKDVETITTTKPIDFFPA